MVELKFIFYWSTSCFALIATLMTLFQLAVFTSSQESSISVLNFEKEIVHQDSYLRPALWNSLLLALFFLQHSGMASMSWKNLIAELQLYTVSRAIYVILTTAALQVLMRYWEPLPTSQPLWHLHTSDRPALWLFFFLIHVAAWILITMATTSMDLAELLGIKQVYYEQLNRSIPLLYKSREEQKLLKHMRHPGTVCLLVVLWCHPVMTLHRALLAISWSMYTVMGWTVTPKDYCYVRQQRRLGAIHTVSHVTHSHRE